ncbi:hypothetical protein F5884DRAFT_10370 [Xylogone sp. PMI_703]|nr:hypothetical protein F5884DRAFT_10370 [Xylogone sp. PMI_703]
MPIGIGSIGDIISVCLLAKDLVEALNNSRGAAKEYQEIIRELWGLERALLQIDLLSRTCDTSPELNALNETARRSAEDCRLSIASFLQKVKKYEPSLRENGSGNLFRDTSRKIQWQMMQSGDLSKFRAEIGAHSQSISMLLATWSVKAISINDRKLNARLTNSESKTEDEMKKQTNVVAEIRDRLTENTRLLSTVATKVTESLRFEWFRQLGTELKIMMSKIFRTNIATYEAVVAIQRVLPSNLERTMFREPFILEDAIGRISPVHMDFINSWEAFDAILRLRFENVQGYKKVQNNEYILQEHATRREIARTRPWNLAFLPGQRVDMSLIFTKKAEEAEATPSTSCPNCHAVSHQSQDVEVQCLDCGMWFRRITEFVDVEPPPAIRITPARPPSERVQFGIHAFQGKAFGPVPRSKFPPVSVKRKLESTDLAEDDIAHFKRIRLVTSKERVKHAPGPFQHSKTFDTDLSLLAMERSKEDEAKAWEEFKVKETTFGSSHPNTLASLKNLTQTLRNVGKSSVVEEILQKIIQAEESKLIFRDPGSLRLLMSNLMTALIDQNKLDAAEDLWSRATVMFSSQTSIEQQDALLRDFRQVHPFRKGQNDDLSWEKTHIGKSTEATVDKTQSSQKAGQSGSSPRSPRPRDSFSGILSKWVPDEQPSQNDWRSSSKPKSMHRKENGKVPAEIKPKPQGYISNPPYMDMSSYIEPVYTGPKTRPLTSFFLPRMKDADSLHQPPCTFTEAPIVCPHCSFSYMSSIDFERHVALYHPFVYMSQLTTGLAAASFSPENPESHYLWLLWVNHGGIEGLLDVKLAWRCCRKPVLTFSELVEQSKCCAREHSTMDIPSIISKLKSLLDSNQNICRLLPKFPLLEPNSKGTRYCEIIYCGDSVSWECFIVDGGRIRYIC